MTALIESWATKFRRWASENVGAAERDDEVVVKTTRYLRLAMVALVVALAAAVLYAHFTSHEADGGTAHCWQTSISAYYYTPAQTIFVGVLIAVGISLIALKGSTEIEDVLLNFAGMFAPLVAVVPTPGPGSCGTVIDTTNRNLNIANNVTAILITAGLAFVVLAVLWRRGHPANATPAPDKSPLENRRARAIATLGYVLAVILYALTWGLFKGVNGWFTNNAHSFSAVAFFVFIFLAVVDNAINFHFTRQRVAGTQPAVRAPHKINRYMVIAALMALAVCVIKLPGLFGASLYGDYETIWLESAMISLFAIFWVIQTQELWDHGLRGPQPSDDAVPPDQSSDVVQAGSGPVRSMPQ